MDDARPHDAGRAQLDAIGRLSETLEDRGIDHWLFGGWAVDFWVGRVTRPHDDIDVAAWHADRDTIADVLTAHGWRQAEADDGVGARYVSSAVLLEFTFVVADQAGRVLIPFEGGPAVWSETQFGDDRRVLEGARCRTLPLSVLRAGKQVPRTESAEAAKDLADFAALARVVGADG